MRIASRETSDRLAVSYKPVRAIALGPHCGAHADRICKSNDFDPQAWLAHVLPKLSDHHAKRIHELLPWNGKASPGNCPSSLSHIGAAHPEITCGTDRMLASFETVQRCRLRAFCRGPRIADVFHQFSLRQSRTGFDCAIAEQKAAKRVRARRSN
jgi:hypothetical protein